MSSTSRVRRSGAARVASSALLAAVLSIAAVSAASADAPASNKNARPVTLSCGSAGTFQTVIVAAFQFLVTSDTRTFVVTSATDPTTGRLLFEVPGLASRSDQLSCTFTSPFDGRTFSVTGFFTPKS